MALQGYIPLFYDNMDWVPDDGYHQTIQQQPQLVMTPVPLPTMVTTFPCYVPQFQHVSVDNPSQPSTSLLEKQRQETDQFLLLEVHIFESHSAISQLKRAFFFFSQSNRLSTALQQQRKRHAASLVKSLEWKTWVVLNQKDQELAGAKKRSLELGKCLKKTEEEIGKWQRISKEKEAVVLSLRGTLERVRDPAFSSSETAAAGGGEEASCSLVPNGWSRCSACWSRDSCVLFIPCMHVCSCTHCASALQSCPLCGCVKASSVEVFSA